MTKVYKTFYKAFVPTNNTIIYNFTSFVKKNINEYINNCIFNYNQLTTDISNILSESWHSYRFYGKITAAMLCEIHIHMCTQSTLKKCSRAMGCRSLL